MVISIIEFQNFVRIINLTFGKKISYQIFCKKSNHTQTQYTIEFSIKESFIDTYNIIHALLPTILSYFSLFISLGAFSL